MVKVSPGGGGATVLPAAGTQHQLESRMAHNIVDALSRERERERVGKDGYSRNKNSLKYHR